MPKIIKVHPLPFALGTLFIAAIIRALILLPTTTYTPEKEENKAAPVVERVLKEYIPQPERSLLAGIVFGAKSDLPPDFKGDLKTTGTVHIVTASGYNLTVVAGFTMAAAAVLSRYGATVLTLIFIILYSYMVGFEPPIVRAALMASLAFTAQLVGKKNNALWTLGLVATSLLIIDPHYIHDISFQLSFLATFGILYVQPLISSALTKVPKIIADELGVTLAAQLTTMPVILYYFGTMSLSAPLANFLVAWTIPPIMLLGALTTLVRLIEVPVIDRVLAVATFLPANYFVRIVEICADAPFASIATKKQDLTLTLGVTLTTVALIIYLKKRFTIK